VFYFYAAIQTNRVTTWFLALYKPHASVWCFPQQSPQAAFAQTKKTISLIRAI